MNEAYCLKCKTKKNIINGSLKTNKKGNKYIQGNCDDCNTKINRILKKDVSMVPNVENNNVREVEVIEEVDKNPNLSKKKNQKRCINGSKC